MNIVFCKSEWWDNFSATFQTEYRDAIVEAHKEAAVHLHKLPPYVNYIVDLAPWFCIKETGSGAMTRTSRQILISLDQDLPYGEEALIKDARATIFHELNHANRYEAGLLSNTFLDGCVMEGLATVFERDLSGSRPLWGQYDEAEIKRWLREIDTLGISINQQDFMYDHPDGRKWIGYKTGTFIVDEAIRLSNRDIVDLSNNATSEEIIGLSGNKK